MRKFDFDDEPLPRGSGPSFSELIGSVNNWLIAINVVVFILDVLSGHRLFEIGYFSADLAISHHQLWRFLTFQFLHANVEHIAFNMISLFFFGPLIERYLGAGRYLAFYLLCGISGVVMYLVLCYAHLLHADPQTPLLGASAGIFGVLIAASQIAPTARVLVIIFPMQLRTMAWLFIGWAIFEILRHAQNAGGEAAHLGGAALGFLLIRKPGLLKIFDIRRRKRQPSWGNWQTDDRR